MKKENLITKWLDNNLNDEEKEAFDKLDVSPSYRKISRAMKAFAPDTLDQDSSYQKLKNKLPGHTRSTGRLRMVSTLIAAIVVVALSVYLFNRSAVTLYETSTGQNLALELPDKSSVLLNAGSTISYNERSWAKERVLELQGEAFFDVEKGSRFVVITDQGTITVLGTEFNVKEREGFFEVSCYEGKVEVACQNQNTILTPGEVVRLIDGKLTSQQTAFSGPSWPEDKSYFKSVPFGEVLDEIERQYGVEIIGDLRNSRQLFTGSFFHENLETALQAVTIPLNLTYTLSGDKVILKIDR
jgi:ferric-dicitrate binding protein FerR (iron transport regulator)